MIIYTPTITHRLSYIADFISGEITGHQARLTVNTEEFLAFDGPKLNYSPARISPDELWMVPHTLLFEKGIREQTTDCFLWNDHKVFFRTGGDIPFDIFAASFFLISRYEEYLPHEKDEYGRYAHQNALAYREGFLNKPLINIWLAEFVKIIQQKFTLLPIRHSRFTFLPTYDIDEAFSFKHKQWWRSSGAALKDLLQAKFSRFSQRWRVLNNRESDPFDAYAWIDELHRSYSLQPRYFFLVPAKTGKYDRNILPGATALQSLIRDHAGQYIIGVHPSWQSGDQPALVQKEKETIEAITGIKVVSSRQHFIRFNLPETFRHLTDAGIREDFSMGYGSVNGFRASVACPFYWYDIDLDQATSLLLYPFCYMEANSFYEQQSTPQEALEEMRHYYQEVKDVNGTLVTIWHNTFLGSDRKFAGWREVYARFVEEVMS